MKKQYVLRQKHGNIAVYLRKIELSSYYVNQSIQNALQFNHNDAKKIVELLDNQGFEIIEYDASIPQSEITLSELSAIQGGAMQ